MIRKGQEPSVSVVLFVNCALEELPAQNEAPRKPLAERYSGCAHGLCGFGAHHPVHARRDFPGVRSAYARLGLGEIGLKCFQKLPMEGQVDKFLKAYEASLDYTF
jgi:hypothetical protein